MLQCMMGMNGTVHSRNACMSSVTSCVHSRETGRVPSQTPHSQTDTDSASPSIAPALHIAFVAVRCVPYLDSGGTQDVSARMQDRTWYSSSMT